MLRAYHERKTTLASSWLNAREQLVSVLLTRQALPLGQMCVIPFCEEEACGRCLNCSPGQFLCANHISLVHAEGRSLHHPEVWKGRWRFLEHSPPVTFSIMLWNPIQSVPWPLGNLVCKYVVLWFNFRDILLFFLTTVYISSTQLLHFMKFLLNSNIHYVSKTCPTFIQRKKWNQWA